VRFFRAIFGTAALCGALVLTLTAAPASASAGVRYVALGDSYSSGLGAGGYIASSGSCQRSANAYPERWAAMNSPASFVSAACSGATTTSVLSGQVRALSARTTLVSITIGGNDAGFATVMETCVLSSSSSCLKAVAKAERFVAASLPGRLNRTLATIRADAPNARVVVVGYPELYDLSRSGSCLGLSAADRTALDRGADALDRALSAAAARHGDIFADVRGTFTGHEICDSAGWLNAIDIFALSSSYHPTASGQDLGYLPAFAARA
jgi:lysophospholipase L1-like esterase